MVNMSAYANLEGCTVPISLVAWGVKLPRRGNRASTTVAGSASYNRSVIERVIRVAGNFRGAERMDRADLAAMSFEERISAVERVRRERFGEDRAESRLDRVLVSADRPTSEVRARGRTRGRRSRR